MDIEDDTPRYSVWGYNKWGGETDECDAEDLEEAHRTGESMLDDPITKTYQIFDRVLDDVVGEG